jgi:hypothetical protein
MNVSNDILTKNINERKLNDIYKTGDYLKIDMFEMKKDIENYFNELTNGFIKYVANINTVDDYETEHQKIIAFLSDNLCLKWELL